jgi:hypothetical protein
MSQSYEIQLKSKTSAASASVRVNNVGLLYPNGFQKSGNPTQDAEMLQLVTLLQKYNVTVKIKRPVVKSKEDTAEFKKQSAIKKLAQLCEHAQATD